MTKLTPQQIAGRNRAWHQAYQKGLDVGICRGRQAQKETDDTRLKEAKRRFKEVIFELVEDVGT
jgi:hypothetical protein